LKRCVLPKKAAIAALWKKHMEIGHVGRLGENPDTLRVIAAAKARSSRTWNLEEHRKETSSAATQSVPVVATSKCTT